MHHGITAKPILSRSPRVRECRVFFSARAMHYIIAVYHNRFFIAVAFFSDINLIVFFLWILILFWNTAKHDININLNFFCNVIKFIHTSLYTILESYRIECQICKRNTFVIYSKKEIHLCDWGIRQHFSHLSEWEIIILISRGWFKFKNEND